MKGKPDLGNPSKTSHINIFLNQKMSIHHLHCNLLSHDCGAAVAQVLEWVFFCNQKVV